MDQTGPGPGEAPSQPSGYAVEYDDLIFSLGKAQALNDKRERIGVAQDNLIVGLTRENQALRERLAELENKTIAADITSQRKGRRR